MPIDLVIDDREGGSKSDSEEITRSSGPLDQVCGGSFLLFCVEEKMQAIQCVFWVTTLPRCYLHTIKAVLASIGMKIFE